MRKTLLALFVAMGSVAAQAEAQTAPTGWATWTSLFTYSGCGGTSFATCMSVDVRQNGGTVGAFVTNAAGPGTFTRVGIVNLGGTINTTNPGISSTTYGAWDPMKNNGLSGAGLPTGIWAWTSPQGINNGLQTGDSGYFTFNVSNLVANQVGIAVHAQGYLNCSTKFGVWQTPTGLATNDVGQAGYDPACSPPVTVPEPESMALLMAGLMGIAFVAVRRRDEDESEA
jgi:hypothetical protein